MKSPRSILLLFIQLEIVLDEDAKHDGLDFDVQIRRLGFLRGQQLDRLLQVKGECVEPEHRQWIQRYLDRVDVGEELWWGHWKKKPIRT